uniref:Uncharacterized protein n=1 Tax=Panagrolaimus sp. ES5 TaxID=591445 RepID=A0AC34F072_9BILA
MIYLYFNIMFSIFITGLITLNCCKRKVKNAAIIRENSTAKNLTIAPEIAAEEKEITTAFPNPSISEAKAGTNDPNYQTIQVNDVPEIPGGETTYPPYIYGRRFADLIHITRNMFAGIATAIGGYFNEEKTQDGTAETQTATEATQSSGGSSGGYQREEYAFGGLCGGGSSGGGAAENNNGGGGKPRTDVSRYLGPN